MGENMSLNGEKREFKGQNLGFGENDSQGNLTNFEAKNSNLNDDLTSRKTLNPSAITNENPIESRYTRVSWLIGDEMLRILGQLKVIIFGLGGVGGVCVDALYRTGFKDFTFVDADSFESTNLNRQLHSEYVGEAKARVFERIYGGKGIVACVDEGFLREFKLSNFDIIIDAIDDISAKVALVGIVDMQKQIFVSSTGGARKIDPTRIKIAPLSKSYGDALAKKFRYELKKAGLKADFEVVFSDEKPMCRELGSFMGVTASFGLALASLILRKVLEKYGSKC